MNDLINLPGRLPHKNDLPHKTDLPHKNDLIDLPGRLPHKNDLPDKNDLTDLPHKNDLIEVLHKNDLPYKNDLTDLPHKNDPRWWDRSSDKRTDQKDQDQCQDRSGSEIRTGPDRFRPLIRRTART